MGRKAKYTKEQKVKACEDYLNERKSAEQVRKESLEQNEYAQYPIVPAARYVRYWNEIERKQKHQKEMIIEEIKNNPDQIGMGC